MYIFFFKQKTAYEMRISDWSSDVCSSDLSRLVAYRHKPAVRRVKAEFAGAGILEVQANQACRATTIDKTDDRLVPQHTDAGIGEQPVLQNSLRTQRITAVDERHGRRMICQVEGFCDCGVTPADNRYRLASIKEDRKNTRLNSSH